MFRFILIASLAAAPVAAHAQSGADPVQNAAPGKIVLYRGSSLVGAGLGCPIRYEGQELVELGRGKYAEVTVSPGDYVLTNKTSSVEVRVAPGVTRYVRCQIKPGMLTGRADLQISDRASFEEHSADYERKDAVSPAVRTASQAN